MFELKLLLFMLDIFCTVNTLNPTFYPCDNQTISNGDIHLECRHRELTKIPIFSSFFITSINLDENILRQVTSDDFLGIQNIQHLSLCWNCLPGRLKALKLPSCKLIIEQYAFVNLKNLASLYLAGNSLQTIPLLPQDLEVLGLEYNNIFHIEQPLGTPFLKELFLAKNCYYANPCNESYYIDQKVFQDLPLLWNLTLGFNNVTSVPTLLPSSLTSLDLKENKITEITEDSFANLTRLSYLNLEWNCQRCDHAAQPCFPCPNNASLKLHHNSFVDQKDSLLDLSLRGNSLHSLPKNLFSQLKRLRSLDLSDNFLAYHIHNGTFFEELQSVVSLSLVYNYEPLKTFPELILSSSISKMKSLRKLYLSGLFVHHISNYSIEPLINLPKLEYIDLRMNFISSCNITAFNHIRALKTVMLSQNILTFNPCNAISAAQALILDRFQKDDNLQMKEISTLSLKRKMRYVNCIVTDFQNSFYTTSIQNFEKCICHEKVFFYLSQNNIPWLNESTFEGMEQAECLDLSFNYISQALNGKQFYRLNKLIYLTMAYNRIDLYYSEAFNELKSSLKVLDLSNNDFHFLMRGMGHNFTFIKNLARLEVLSLADNKIGIRISTTLNSTSLKYLFFSGNRLDIMWDTRGDQYISFFQGLIYLSYLDISNNQLRYCSPEAIVNLPSNINVLRMDSNQLNYFPWANVSVLQHLMYLNLSGNHLSNLSDGSNLSSNLRSLDLSHNRLNVIPELFFSKATSLKELMLNNNQLKSLEMQVLPPPFRKGNTPCILTIHANPFICSCATSSFTDFLRTSPLIIPQLTTDVRCGFPESQTGINIFSIDPRSCQEIFGSVAFLCTALLTIAATTIPILRHLFGWDLWYCFQVLWAGHKGYSTINGTNMVNNQYDAFVVFDTRNKAVRDWIYNEMLINLEGSGRWRFQLCLEERDWVPGLSCIENLHNSVYNSRKTVFVLTNQGDSSSINGMIKQTFFLVQQRLLDQKNDVAVLILLDPVFPKLKYLELRKRLCRKSVLSWPPNPQTQPLFWNNLHVALASDNVRAYDEKIKESFMSYELL